MSKYAAEYSAAHLLRRLRNEGLITDKALPDFIISRQHKEEQPFYVNALASIGVLVASWFFISAMILVLPDAAPMTFIINGAVFIIIAATVQRKFAADADTMRRRFALQLALVFMLSGKILLSNAAGELWEDSRQLWGVISALFIVSVATYKIYTVSAERFLSAFAVLLLILVEILINHRAQHLVWLSGYFLIQFAGTVFLLMHPRINRDYLPLTHALVVSLCLSAIAFSYLAEFSDKQALYANLMINMILSAWLIALFARVAGGWKKLKTEPLRLAVAGAILLGGIYNPGVLLAVGLLVLGYAKHEKVLTIAAAVLLPISLLVYYQHHAELSAVQLSLMLVINGLLLLLGRMYLRRRTWDK